MQTGWDDTAWSMMRSQRNRVYYFYVVAAACLTVYLGLMGCSSPPPPKPVTFSGFLHAYSGFRPASDGSGALVYLKPGRNLKPYTKIMFDPLVLWYDPGSKYQGIDTAHMGRLALAFQTRMAVAMRGGYEVVYRPGPGVLRLRAALTNVVPAQPEVGTPGPVLPLVNDAVAATTDAVTQGGRLYLIPGTSTYVGQATIEAELLDSSTNERLGGYIETRQTSQFSNDRSDRSFKSTVEAFDFWAQKLRRRLDIDRGLITAPPPS